MSINQEKSTHFIFNGERIIISPNLHSIVVFLREIELEIDTILGIEKRLESIKKQYLETIKLVELLASKLKENSIDFTFELSEYPEKIVEKLKIERPSRIEMIILFANLEVLMCLNIAYKNNTSDDSMIRKLAMNQNVIDLFLRDYCLNMKNEWYRNNINRAKFISTDNLRKLRNSLTHFFSVDKGLSISIRSSDSKTRRLEKATNFKAKFISPEDLYEILRGAAMIMIQEWNDDCMDDQKGGSNYFKEKILSVNSIIEKNGVIIINNGQINI